MVAVGAEVVTSGVVSFLLLILLLLIVSIFLTALCSECNRRSFELRHPEANKDPTALIKVVKLEEAAVARENPMISEIQNDEKEFNRGEGNMVSSVPSWKSHLEAPQSRRDVPTNGSAAVMKTGSDHDTAGAGNPEEVDLVQFPPWRSHLNQGVNGSAPPDHTYHTIGGGSSPPSNQEPEEEHNVCSVVEGDSMYARVSKKLRQTTPPDHTPEEEEEEEDESSPPLPNRTPQLEV